MSPDLTQVSNRKLQFKPMFFHRIGSQHFDEDVVDSTLSESGDAETQKVLPSFSGW